MYTSTYLADVHALDGGWRAARSGSHELGAEEDCLQVGENRAPRAPAKSTLRNRDPSSFLSAGLRGGGEYDDSVGGDFRRNDGFCEINEDNIFNI